MTYDELDDIRWHDRVKAGVRQSIGVPDERELSEWSDEQEQQLIEADESRWDRKPISPIHSYND